MAHNRKFYSGFTLTMQITNTVIKSKSACYLVVVLICRVPPVQKLIDRVEELTQQLFCC